MGFRNPISTATDVDTGPTPTGPGVRMFQDTQGGFPRGVVEFRDGVQGDQHATLTREVLAVDQGGFFTTTGGTFSLDAGTLRGMDAGGLDFLVQELGGGGYEQVTRLRSPGRLDLGPIARLLQTAGSGNYAAGQFGTIVFHTAEVDPYGGFVITPPATVSSRWTCPQAGLYAVAGRVPINSVNPGNTATARLLLNGVPIQGSLGDLLTQASPAGSSSPTTDRVLVDLVPGDFLELQGFVSGQLWATRVTSDGVAPTLTIERKG